MELRVRLFAGLRERAGRDEIVVRDLPAGVDVAGLKRALQQLHPELGDLAHVSGVVGTTWVRDDRALAEGDAVALLPPVSGGAPGPDDEAAFLEGVFELSAEPLDVGRCAERVGHPACGGVAVFAGNARDHARGRRVLRLEYEAFAEMTGPQMRRIFERARAECAPAGGEADLGEPRERMLRMLVAHRIGVVEIGEPAVVVAAASPHRDAAFRACRFLIDELKKTLPVWKKEHYEDGGTWIGERS